MDINIRVGNLTIEAQLNDSPTAHMIFQALPIHASFSTWGDEIYFPIPIQAELDDSARDIVELGELGYWPPGKAFCIFYGLTPMSKPGEIRPASAVNIVGRIKGDPTRFKQVMREREVVLEAM